MELINKGKLQINNKIKSDVYIPASMDSAINTCPTFSAIINSLIRQEDLDFSILDFIGYYRDNRILKFSEFDQNKIYTHWRNFLRNDYLSISHARIAFGFEVGIIDHINGAMKKTIDGWVNEKNTLVLNTDASINDVEKYISNKTSILPVITESDVESFIKNKEIKINEEVIAKYNDDNEAWYYKNGYAIKVNLNESNSYNGIKRILSHSDCVVYLNGKHEKPLFHGTTSKNEEPTGLSGNPSSLSRQGQVTYTTHSHKEAISIYANPLSSEVMNYRFESSGGKETYKNMKDIYGHIFEVKADENSNIYISELSKEQLNTDLLPSPYLISLIADEFPSESRKFFNKMQSKLYSSCNTYDVYQAINELTNDLMDNQFYDEKNILKNGLLKTIFSSMGYEGIDITFPTTEYFDSIDLLIEEIKKNDIQNLTCFEQNRIRLNEIEKQLSIYKTKLTQSIPTKGLVGHTLFFNTSKSKSFEVTKMHLLPIHPAIQTKKSTADIYDFKLSSYPSLEDIYTLDNKINKDSILREPNINIQLNI